MAAAANVDFSLFGGPEELPENKKRLSTSSDSSSIDSSSSDCNPVLDVPSQYVPKQFPLDPNDWLWVHTEEPHRSRRKAIMAAHPEVTKLMGHEPLTKYVVAFVVGLQLCAAYYFRNTHPISWSFIITAYVLGGTANQNLFLAIHEITHNLAFKNVKPNKFLAMFANLPIGIPYAMLFKDYHIEHHKFLGEDGIDTDIPTKLELILLRNVAGKAFFATFQIFFYALRPGFIKAQKLTAYHITNIFAQLAFDYLVVKYFGWYPLFYFLFSAFFAGSLHPCAAHFIAEHYMFDGWGQETWSYYGPLNILCYNVGYHNEHHDFANVPWTRLEALRQLAPEFYNNLPYHTSWPMVTIRFIFEDTTGLFARIKREPKKKAT